MGWGPCFISLREAWPATVGLALAAQGCGLFETQQAFTAYSGSGSDTSTHDAAAQGHDGGTTPPDGPLDASNMADASREAVAPGVSTLAAGGAHTCLISGGALYCWGWNDHRQLGPTSCDAQQCGVTHVPMGDGAAPAVEVSAGYVHSCARLADNSLHCWGDNAFGELGLGEVPPSNGAYGTVVAPSTPLVQVSVGARDTCAVANDGTVYCWGLNTQGQLAHASDAMALTQPTQVPGLTGVAEVQLGGNWACARLLDGGVDCWGNNVGAGYHCDSGALCTPIPTPIHGLGGLDGGAAHLAVGPLAACAIMADTSVRCWGYNSDNELGNGSSQSGLAATTVVYVTSFLPLVDVVDLGMGSAGTCAVLVDGGVACWGTTAFGGGAEAALVTMAPAVQVSLNTYEIQSSGFAGCVKRTDGGVSCLGSNAEEQLGRTGCDAGCALGPVVGLP